MTGADADRSREVAPSRESTPCKADARQRTYLATVTTPPASFLAAHPSLPARAEQLPVYQLISAHHVVTRPLEPCAGEPVSTAVIVARGDAKTITAKLGEEGRS